MSIPSNASADTQLLWPAYQPDSDEGLLGWVAQNASEQFIASTFLILRAAGQAYRNKRHERKSGGLDAERLAEVMMTTPDLVRERLYDPVDDTGKVRFFGATVQKWHINSNVRRFSPASLRQRCRHRGSWEHQLIPFCMRSWEFLASRCPRPDCRATQGWYWAGGIANCDHCSEPLTEGRRRLVPEEWRDSLRFAAGLVSSDPSESEASMRMLPACFKNEDRGEIFGLIVHLAALSNHLPISSRNIKWWTRRPFRLAYNLHRAGNAVLGWPHGLETHLGNLANQRVSTIDVLRHRAAGFSLRIDHLEQGSLAHRLLIEAARKMQADGVGRHAGNHEAYSIRTVMEKLGSDTAQVARDRRAGLLSTKLMLRHHKIVPAFDRQEIDRLQEALRHRISVPKIGLLLGIPSYAVEHLAHLRLLTHNDAPYLATRRPWPFIDERDVHQFKGELMARAVDLDASFRFSLSDCMKMVGGRLKPWSAALAELHGGKLPFAVRGGTGPLSRRLVVRADHVTSILACSSPVISEFPARDGRLISRPEALDVLNLGLPQTADLAPLMITNSEGDKGIPLDVVVEIAHQRIAGAEIIARWEVKSCMLSHHFRRAGVHKDSKFGWGREAATKTLDELGIPRVLASE